MRRLGSSGWVVASEPASGDVHTAGGGAQEQAATGNLQRLRDQDSTEPRNSLSSELAGYR